MKIHVCTKHFTPCVIRFSNTSKLGQKYSAVRRIFNSLVGVEIWSNMVYFVFDIFHTMGAATYIACVAGGISCVSAFVLVAKP